MAEAVELVAQGREAGGTTKARRLRKKGLVPAIVYGHGEANLPIAVDGEQIEKVIRQGVHVLDLKADGKTEKALIRDLQWDHLGKHLLHVDFYRVSADERIEVTVPLEIRGTAPGIAAGGVLDQPLHRLTIECLAVAVPDSIRVNVNELQLEQAIHVKDLKLPEGVVALDEPDAVVVQVRTKEEEPEEEAGAAAEQAEPEVIARKKAEEEGD